MQAGLKAAKETMEQLLLQRREGREPEARISAITRRIDKQRALREQLVEKIRAQDVEIRRLQSEMVEAVRRPRRPLRQG